MSSCRILIYSGTTEGRRLAEKLSENHIECVVSVATEYGSMVMPEMEYVTVRTGRMDGAMMREFTISGGFQAVIDATHPFAVQVSKCIRESLKGTDIPYIRLKREVIISSSGGNIRYFDSAAECAEALEETDGNILLTTGSHELPDFCRSSSIKKKLYVRILPAAESLMICEENGIMGRQIIAMQGPFDMDMNRALIRQFGIRHIVTKESGTAGGYQEKIDAADAEGIDAYVLGIPEKTESGCSFAEVCVKISAIAGKKIRNRVSLLGAGMGDRDSLTVRADNVLRGADVIFGAPRLIKSAGRYTASIKKPFYLAEDILPCLDDMSGMGLDIAVMFSGDTGFYSGCSSLYRALDERNDCSVTVYPGISSVSYLAALTGNAWQASAVISVHGHGADDMWKEKLIASIRHNKSTYLLVSGAEDVRMLGMLLVKAGLEGCIVTAGYQLSGPDQELRVLSPSECSETDREGLYTCLIENPDAECRRLSPCIRDESLLRDRVPMTKAEIREICIYRLMLRENSVVYDIGSGTGSVALEIAKSGPDIRVYAIERNATAVQLIYDNKDCFMAYNIKVVEGRAPEALEGLEVPTHAFIGGSGGKLSEILDALYLKNPVMRIVITAVSLETVARLALLKDDGRICDLELVQVQASRAAAAGKYQLMRAEDPVYICSFSFRKEV